MKHNGGINVEKLFALCLALCLALSLGACGSPAGTVFGPLESIPTGLTFTFTKE